MPHNPRQPADLGDVPRLHDMREAAAILRVGINKFLAMAPEIDCVRMGNRRFWTDRQLAAFLGKRSVKGRQVPQ